MLLGVNILKKGNFAFFKNTNFYLRIPIKDKNEEDPWISKFLGNRRKLAFIFSNSFCKLIIKYLGLLYLPFWGFY